MRQFIIGTRKGTTRSLHRHGTASALSCLTVAILLASCASGPETLNVRVRNHAAHNLRVQCLNGEAAGREEVVQPGAFAQSHASAVLVHAPGKSIHLSVTPALVSGGSESGSGVGYKYAHQTLRGLGQDAAIFEVMVDNENHAWIHTRDGERVAFPQDHDQDD
jgi:hypothetical protein